MLKHTLAAVSALLLSACAIVDKEKPGVYWCNEPFLKTNQVQFEHDELSAARNGYMYVTAAALALQGDSEEDRAHWIEIPKRLTPIQPDPIYGDVGFQARAFLLHKSPGSTEIEALVVAFTGSQFSDFWKDWFITNIAGSTSQHLQARELVKRLTSKYPSVPKRVLTGFSLGGALASHVALHPETSKLVDEVWAFNPSGRIFDMRSNEEKEKTASERDPRFWLVANYAEGIRYTRSNFLSWMPGIDWIPAPKHQFVNRIELIKTNPVQGHYRYILFRDLIFAAEQDARIRGVPESKNEPLEILRDTRFAACTRA
jgi:hypothetical protein